MNAVAGIDAIGWDDWETLSASHEDKGYKVREVDGYFRHSRQIEAMTRFVGIMIILGAFVHWLFPNADFAGGNPMLTKVLLSVAFSVTGLAVYSFATRGHRNEVLLDPVRHEIRIAALNRRDESRQVTRIPLAKVKSIYVKRPKSRTEPASLQIRMRDSVNEVCALRGDEEEMESFHRFLCRDIRMTRPF